MDSAPTSPDSEIPGGSPSIAASDVPASPASAGAVSGTRPAVTMSASTRPDSTSSVSPSAATKSGVCPSSVSSVSGRDDKGNLAPSSAGGGGGATDDGAARSPKRLPNMPPASSSEARPASHPASCRATTRKSTASSSSPPTAPPSPPSPGRSPAAALPPGSKGIRYASSIVSTWPDTGRVGWASLITRHPLTATASPSSSGLSIRPSKAT